MHAVTLLLLDAPEPEKAAEAAKVLSVELGDASVRVAGHGANLDVAASVHDVSAHDLCTHGSGVSEVLLARWHEGERSRAMKP